VCEHRVSWCAGPILSCDHRETMTCSECEYLSFTGHRVKACGDECASACARRVEHSYENNVAVRAQTRSCRLGSSSVSVCMLRFPVIKVSLRVPHVYYVTVCYVSPGRHAFRVTRKRSCTGIQLHALFQTYSRIFEKQSKAKLVPVRFVHCVLDFICLQFG
jgi:hypothetical protein